MVDPFDIIKFDRTDVELEELMIFVIFVAGKNAAFISSAVQDFLQGSREPFETVREYIRKDILRQNLERSRVGKYTLLERSLIFMTKYFDGKKLRNASIEELEKIPGVGMKSSRCFVLWSRPNQQVAALDVHILKFLRDMGISTPMSTPAPALYRRLEQKFLEFAAASKKSPAEFDLEIWTKYTKNKPTQISHYHA